MPRLSNPYVLLAGFLAPTKGFETLQKLNRFLEESDCELGQVLGLSNLHLCTPLWYLRLTQDGLLGKLPAEMSQYLNIIHQANVERNLLFRRALSSIIASFLEADIEPVLLKGAATFCDDLYGGTGARVMGDLDLLVEPTKADSAQDILQKMGYERCSGPRVDIGISPCFSHHHLDRLHLPGTPVVVEIHFRLQRGQAGRVMPTAPFWEQRERAFMDGMPVSVLNPTGRVLHNAIHALSPAREFIRSNISLLQLAEFAALARRYRSRISWTDWVENGRRGGMGTEFSTYARLVQEMMGVNLPGDIACRRLTKIHAARIAAAGREAAESFARPTRAGVGRKLTRLALRSYYNFQRPLWIWRNPCFAAGFRNFPLRLVYLRNYLLSVMQMKAVLNGWCNIRKVLGV